jgi:UDP-2,3-diacylglucosamine hydrolase
MQELKTGPIIILAGSGQLPLLLSNCLHRQQLAHKILALKGFAETSLMQRAAAKAHFLDIEAILKQLDAWKPSSVTLAGAVHRPKPSSLMSALSFLRNRQDLAQLLSRGDDQVLRGVVQLLEERGHTVRGIHDLAPELLARPALYGTHAPDEAHQESIALGRDCLNALSPFDVGQALVVKGRRVVAIEGLEGTDRMMRRIKSRWPARLFGNRQEGGILIKMAKCTQDLRVDLPAIGPRTVKEASKAGLSGIAIGAGSTLVLDEAQTIREANRLGLFLIGIDGSKGEAS